MSATQPWTRKFRNGLGSVTLGFSSTIAVVEGIWMVALNKIASLMHAIS